MSNDLQQIKKRIVDDDRIEELLEKAECESIKFKHNRYEAMLPSKFNSDNNRALQVYLNENLTCKVRSRNFQGRDIFHLIAYIVFDCVELDKMQRFLPKSKRWICEQLGYDEYIEGRFPDFDKQKEDPLKWLKELKKKRNKRRYEVPENRVYDESVLMQYVMYPYPGYIEEGIDYETQQLFNVGFDVLSERIIFPIYNSFGEIVSVKGRTIDPDYKQKNIPKFLYMFNFNKAQELYNWNLAVYYILQKKEIIIYEAEKTVWKSWQWGYQNCVALGGSEITDFQVQMIKNLGLEISIVLAFDRDKTPDEIKQQARKFGQTRSIYVMWDGRKVFSAEAKHSPADLTKEAFEQLYNDRHKYKLS